MEVIILSITPYKEKDAIIKAVHENGLISFLVRSLFKPNSKLAFLNCPLSIVDILLLEGNYKYPILKTAHLLRSSFKINSDYLLMSSMLLIQETSIKLLNENELTYFYPLLKRCIDYFEVYHLYNIVLFFMVNVLEQTGFKLEGKKCAKCGKEHGLSKFSFYDGGFLCEDCSVDVKTMIYSKRQKEILFSLLNLNKDEQFLSIEIEQKDFVFLLERINEFVYDSYGQKLNAIDLILIK